MSETESVQPVRVKPDQVSGMVLVMASAAMVVFMAIHPSPHSHELSEFVADFAMRAVFNMVVHGVLMGMLVLILMGLAEFSARLGLGSFLVRGGLVAAVLGSVVLIGAAMINGLVLSRLCVKYSGTSGPTLESLRPLLVLCTEGNHACDHMGIVLQSASIVLWSAVLVRREGTRWLGVFGLMVGLVAPSALFAGQLPMTVHGFGAFVLATAVWYVWAGISMIRGRV